MFNLYGFHIITPIMFISQSPIFSPHPCCIPRDTKQNKVSKQENKSKNNKKKSNNAKQKRTTPQTEKKSLLLLFSWLSITSSEILMALEVSVCHIAFSCVPSAWLATVRSNESLVQGLWVSVQHPQWVLSRACLGYPLSWRSWGCHSAGLVPSWASAELIWMLGGGGQHKCQLWAWVLGR